MIFINKGDKPLTAIQATNRGISLFEAQKPQYVREAGLLQGSQEYLAWANQWLSDNEVNALNNVFNQQLYAFRLAVLRGLQYRLAVGRPEVTEQFATGAYDQNGDAITETVVTVTAIEPLPATVTVVTYDDEGGPTTLVIQNPLVTLDVEERAAALAVVAGTPAAVVTFDD